MAWWPFGKKKASEPATAPTAKSADGERTMEVPPPTAPQDGAPTLFVPPGGALQQEPIDQPTLAPGAADQLTLAPRGPSPSAGAADQLTIPPKRGGPADDPFGNDPFAAPAMRDLGKTLDDDKAPRVPGDPFANPGGHDLAQTMGDDRTIPPSHLANDQDLTIPPSHIRGGPPAPRPAAAGRGAAPSRQPVAEAEPADASEKTLKMPPRSPAGAELAPAASAPSATLEPSVAHEETPMLAKTAALSPEKLRLGRALLAGGPITQERLEKELDKSGKKESVLGKALLKSNFPREEEILAALVAQIRIPKINVKNTKIPLETIRIVPADVAKRFQVLPIERIGDILVIVSPGVGDEDALAAVRKATGCIVFPFQCDADGFGEVVSGYYDRLASSGLQAPAPELTAPAPAPRPVAAGAPIAALPADDGQDDWDRHFAAAGPVPAEEVLL
jgi:hypothetical protein